MESTRTWSHGLCLWVLFLVYRDGRDLRAKPNAGQQMQKALISEAGRPRHHSGSAIFLNKWLHLSGLQFTYL